MKTNQQASTKPFTVLHQTKRHLVVQTHAGEALNQVDKKNPANFGAFNLGMHVGDDPIKVLRNRQKLLLAINEYLQKNASSKSVQPITVIHWLNQVHGNRVVNLDDEPLGLTPHDADAMISTSPQTALAIMTADCVPIGIMNDQTGQMASIHAGWQGVANGVIGKTCEALQNVNNSADSYQAVIGACISQSRYEVSKEVADKVLAGCKHMVLDTDKLRQTAIGGHEDSNKAWLDLPAIATAQLEHFGIQVINSEQCSYQNHTPQNYSYYSHRRMTHEGQASTGRMALVVVRL